MDELKRFWKVFRDYETLFIPFETEFENLLFEKYRDRKQDKKLKVFYAIKFLIPRFLQIYLRRIRACYLKNDFPRWPIETYLEDFKRKILEDIDGNIPFIWFWPNNKNFVFCLTHDVETKQGLKKINKICEIEMSFGLRSAWYFVPEKYYVSKSLIKELQEDGFEVGIHGLKHDGKLFDTKKIFNERMARIKMYIRKWNAKGFRSPSLIRRADWLKELPFEYDSSFPDTDPYGPQPGGCLSIFPFFIGNIVELPVTLPQDHTLFEILKEKDISIWRKKIDWIEKMHGLALIIVHPDYFTNDTERYYIELLEFILAKKNVWYAKPLDICKWWQDRAKSHIVVNGLTNFVITGPAEMQGSIKYLGNFL